MKAPQRFILEEAVIGVGFMILGWYVYFLVAVWGMLDYLEQGPLRSYVTGPAIHIEILVSSLGLGVLFAVVNRITEAPAFRRRPVGFMVLARGILYAIGLGLVVVGVHAVFLLFVFTRAEIQGLWAAMSLRLLVSLAGFLLLSFLGLAFFLEVRRKVGPGNLGALLTGRYHRPREEDRIFLFLDLKGSTGIAEGLGHARYSQFIRSCYQDLTESILTYRAEIYQYVGDEVVLTWPASRGGADARSLDTYFAFQERLKERHEWYRREFGAIPEFRAGIERGMVTATEVGDIKREIAFHGDALNTAARLLELCREYDAPVLISGRVRKSLEAVARLPTRLRGEVRLRGMAHPTPVYGVERAVEA